MSFIRLILQQIILIEGTILPNGTRGIQPNLLKTGDGECVQ